MKNYLYKNRKMTNATRYAFCKKSIDYLTEKLINNIYIDRDTPRVYLENGVKVTIDKKGEVTWTL